ncbi:SnoaL-like domain-containing protein [Aquimarina amphilecti]|uniref:SnoaL-like domain-containing protein n=1 Tax=Aquimarina amphilecti TaxID=1038014 RepID=A0A1H7MC92_AQUAM|nr:hypothetical protein [Aquimarina amphilecti]SEL08711.1 SnoaL-like domain-containing protein [Aquimarina amphilecti]
MNTQTKQGIKKTIESLIETATTFDIEKLDSIYHDNMQVIMIDASGQTMISNKQTFKDLFQSKLDNGDEPLNTWAEFYHIESNQNNGHAILKRKVNLTGVEQKIALSIDLIWEDNRWQVTREVIFTEFE